MAKWITHLSILSLQNETVRESHITLHAIP